MVLLLDDEISKQSQIMADFDHTAHRYDMDFTNTTIGKAQRNLVYRILQSEFKSFNHLKVLELNAGTGEDARWFASQMAEVTCTDISQEMLNQAILKNENRKNIVFKQLNINDLDLVNEKFDLIFSNFGGLNCLSNAELDTFLFNAYNRLNKGGRMVLVMMPRFTLWESIYYLSKFNLRNIFRRNTSKGINVHVDGKMVMTFYYSPGVFRLNDLFKINSISPIGLFVPPSYFQNKFDNMPKLLNFLSQVDTKFLNNSFFARMSDHFCIVLTKK